MYDNLTEFQISLKYILSKKGRGAQIQLTNKLDLSRGYISQIISGKRYGSDEIQRKIAATLGYPGRAYEDFLDIGRALLTKKDPSEHIYQRTKEVVDIMITGLTPEQLQVLQKFRDLLVEGGEGIEAIASTVSALAEKKLSGQGAAIYQKK